MRCRHWSALVLCSIAGLILTGCRIPLALVPALPETASTVTVRTRLEQPFYSAADGLSAIQLKLNLPGDFAPGERPSLGGGGVLRVSYAPESDPRYPDADFYAWPAQQGWIGELVPGRVISQEFLSRYPGLDGITVRVGTYGADVGRGHGTLRNDVTATVRTAPPGGLEVTTLPGGATVDVIGSREGWIRVRLPDGREGYIDRTLFATLPEPTRRNWGALVLRLYRLEDGTLLRESKLSVADLTDESHVTFHFEPVSDSYQVRYRFEIEAIGSAPGHAVTLWGDARTGDLVFRPSYERQVLAEARLDEGRWSGVQGTLEVRFPAIHPTRDTYLRIELEAGERPLIAHWSNTRPPGGLPLSTSDNPGIWGGVVFNARYMEDVPVLGLSVELARRSLRILLGDRLLAGTYGVLGLAVTIALGWGWRRYGR